MKPIKGTITIELPYEQLEFVGILMFDVYPSTIVYKNKNNDVVIKEWVDCSDDNKINRYFYYSVGNTELKRFIDGKLSHLEMINSSIEDVVYFQDEGYRSDTDVYVVSVNSIPFNYLPKSDFIFNRAEGVDTELIINNFDLNRYNNIDEIIPFRVKQFARQANSETLYIHIDNGKGVGHGTIKTEILGKTLLSIDKLYKNIALDYLKGKERGDIQLEAKGSKDFVEYTDTEVFGFATAASYGFMIRPVTSQIDGFKNTPAFNIASKAINLITKSKEPKELKGEYESHSVSTIKSFEEFLTEVYKKELKMDLNWFNPKENVEISSSIDYRNANVIIEGMKALSASRVEKIERIGKFRAIDCDTAHFIFISTGEEKFSGYFDKNTREGINKINFIDIYKIAIERNIEKNPGKRESVSYKIITCYLDTP
jgi:hypothetical protein